MIFPTSGIVLKNVKYGETSAVVTVYTREFGLQSYMVNNVRSKTKGAKGHLYQHASILDLQVYHNSLKNLQRIKEAEWKKVYRNILTDVERHSAAVFIIELMLKTIQHEERNYSLYDFAERLLLELDSQLPKHAANVPLLFAVQWPALLGFQMHNNYSESNQLFDVREGAFTGSMEVTTPESSPHINAALSSLLKMSHVEEVDSLKLNGAIRRKILLLIVEYFKWHIDGFRELNTLRILL